ncbi:hypothetical protein SDC9_107172 [bioreactor metagenome]|uniref:Uncharacterized protein n=1 Tax=bioreactor metagenome TaxID=1076179 RepID=A0A645B6S6_9ZZZZ
MRDERAPRATGRGGAGPASPADARVSGEGDGLAANGERLPADARVSASRRAFSQLRPAGGQQIAETAAAGRSSRIGGVTITSHVLPAGLTPGPGGGPRTAPARSFRCCPRRTADLRKGSSRVPSTGVRGDRRPGNLNRRTG